MLNSFNLYKGEWLALVFEHRNQKYGAFALRKESDAITAKSLFIAAGCFIGLFVGGQLLVSGDAPKKNDDNAVIEVELTPLTPKLAASKAVGPPQKQASVAVAKSVAVSKIVVVKAPDAKTQIKTDDLAGLVADAALGEGDIGRLATGAGIGEGQPDGTGLGGDTGNGVHEATGLQVYPEFPGGMEAWAKFLSKNLNYPNQAEENNITGKVLISFVVEKDGKITHVKVLRGIGYGCDEEAVRVISKSPRWNPGFQNNRPVRVSYQIPISYNLIK